MTREPVFVGIDGGGTRTRALAVDHRGVVVGQAEGGSINRNHHSHAEARQALTDVLARCIPDGRPIGGLLIGTSGILTESDREDVRRMALGVQAVSAAERLWVEHDTLVALVGGLGNMPGIVLIAGTGTACYGRNADGADFLCSGWGALADDAGSAYWMAVEAIRASVRAEDGRGPETTLKARCFEALGLETPRQLLDRLHNPGVPRDELAMLATIVVDAWEEGDSVATEIAFRAIHELALCVKTVGHRLFPWKTGIPTVLVGGLANSGPPFTPALTRALHHVGATVREPLHSPVEGAAHEARRRFDADPTLTTR